MKLLLVSHKESANVRFESWTIVKCCASVDQRQLSRLSIKVLVLRRC